MSNVSLSCLRVTPRDQTTAPLPAARMVLDQEVGLGGVGETVGEPDALDPMGMGPQQFQHPIEKFPLLPRVEVIATRWARA